MTERIAIIDLGSNSARLIVMHIYYNGAYNLVYNEKETVRLSEGMSDNQLLQPEAMERALGTLKVFAHMCKLFQVDKILAVGTAALRNALNGPDFVQRVKQETGIPLRAISGESEAKLGYLGVINTLDVTDALLFDLGGGSTELTLIRNRKAEKVISLPFGAVNLTEQFSLQNKISDTQLNELYIFIMHQLDRIPWLKNISIPLIGVGGTARNIAKMDQKRKNYPFPKVHNYRLGSISFNDLWKVMAKTSLAQRRKFPGLSSERADIIVSGLSIVKCLLDSTMSTQLIISGCGVREGLFLQYYLSRAGQGDLVSDTLLHSTHNMLLFYKGDTTHAYHVAALAESLFDGWQPLLKLQQRDRTLLRVAALLHDIGITINYYDHARHSAYLVENARLFGLTHREQMLAAVIAGWHNGPSSKYVRNRIYSEFLDDPDWQTARKLSLLLTLAESMDTTQLGLVKEVKASLQTGQPHLKLITNEPAPIEYQALKKYMKWLNKELGVDLVLEK
jgi:exopolyphosphatase/guanosine-5'-triphosphate,3'-diphosphate pyrophosphatase